MNIPGIPASPYPIATGTTGHSSRTQTDQRPQPASVDRPVATPLLPTRPQPTGGASTALPVQPPPGTDPTLWSVLNAEERAYFAKVGAMGPLTYGRVLSSQVTPPTPELRGGRLDRKV